MSRMTLRGSKGSKGSKGSSSGTSISQYGMEKLRRGQSAIAPRSSQVAQKAVTSVCLVVISLICWFSIGVFPSLLFPSLSSVGHGSFVNNSIAYAQDLPDLEDVVPAPPTFNASDIQVDDISSEKISQFVRAYVQVVELIDQREAELQQAETELESLRIQHDIVAEAFSKIEATGLSQQEYLQLLGLANIDPEFGDRIATQLEEIRP